MHQTVFVRTTERDPEVLSHGGQLLVGFSLFPFKYKRVMLESANAPCQCPLSEEILPLPFTDGFPCPSPDLVVTDAFHHTGDPAGGVGLPVIAGGLLEGHVPGQGGEEAKTDT